MLTMINLNLLPKTPYKLSVLLSERIRKRRKELKFSQEELSRRSGVSLGSLKRFETQHEISLKSFLCLVFTLGMGDEIEQLFLKKRYLSIEDVINENN